MAMGRDKPPKDLREQYRASVAAPTQNARRKEDVQNVRFIGVCNVNVVRFRPRLVILFEMRGAGNKPAGGATWSPVGRQRWKIRQTALHSCPFPLIYLVIITSYNGPCCGLQHAAPKCRT